MPIAPVMIPPANRRWAKAVHFVRRASLVLDGRPFGRSLRNVQTRSDPEVCSMPSLGRASMLGCDLQWRARGRGMPRVIWRSPLPELPVEEEVRGSRVPDRCYPAAGEQRGVSTARSLFSPPACRSRMFSRNPSTTPAFSRAP